MYMYIATYPVTFLIPIGQNAGFLEPMFSGSFGIAVSQSSPYSYSMCTSKDGVLENKHTLLNCDDRTKGNIDLAYSSSRLVSPLKLPSSSWCKSELYLRDLKRKKWREKPSHCIYYLCWTIFVPFLSGIQSLRPDRALQNPFRTVPWQFFFRLISIHCTDYKLGITIQEYT